MDPLLQNPDLLTAVSGMAEVAFTVLAAIITGIWVLNKWLTERREAREQQERLEKARLEQQRREDLHERARHAADLIQAFGQADDEQKRMWSAMSLALYPDEALPLLVNALGQMDDSTSIGVEMALVSMDMNAAPQLIKMNRVARWICFAQEERMRIGGEESSAEETLEHTSAERLRKRSARTLNQIFLNTDPKMLEKIDLADVDLSGANFAYSDLGAACFRKAYLNQAVFSHARIRRANFRGARINKAVFTRAAACEADFTGVCGAAEMIRILADSAIFKDAVLKGSRMEAADLRNADLTHANLERVTLDGAQLHGAELKSVRLQNVSARAAHLEGCRLHHANLFRAGFEEAFLTGASFESCRMNQIRAVSIQGKQSAFLNCNLSAANFSQAHLNGATFVRCMLNAAVFDSAVLENCVFENCKLAAASFKNAHLSGTQFRGKNEVGGTINFRGANWQDAVFEEQSAALRAAAEASTSPSTSNSGKID